MKSTRGKSILETILEHGEMSLSELARETGYSRSWTWKKVRALEKQGIVETRRRGRIVTVAITPSPPPEKLLIIGILRATEYPYILPLKKKLEKRFPRIHIRVYDDPYKASTDLATGKTHLAMAPAVTLLLTHRLSGGRIHIVGGGSGGGAGIAYNPQVAGRGRGHATTMASSMEYCATRAQLEGPRVYASSGDELLTLVSTGRVEAAALWEPYLSLARLRGLRVEPCELPVCCLLGANSSLSNHYDFIRKVFAESVAEARRRRGDPVLQEAYSRLVHISVDLARRSMPAYSYYEEPPLQVLEREATLIREVVLPSDVVKRAVV